MIKYSNLHVRKILQLNIPNAHFKKGVYHGIWEFGKIENSIRFTYRTPKIEYSESYKGSNKSVHDSSEYYQRLVSNERTSKIIDFLIFEIQNNNSLIIFPSTFIVSIPLTEMDSEEEFMSILEKSDKNDFIEENLGVFLTDKNEVILPEIDSLLIVDGQHRLAAIQILVNTLRILIGQKKLTDFDSEIKGALQSCERKIINNNVLEDYKTILENLLKFEISCTLLLDFDIWEQAKVFADVNFNQKSVNRSLYYDIYGSFPNEDKNELFLLHKWCVNLNSKEESRLNNKINLLGSGPGFISQAFLCDALLPYLRKGGIWFKIASDFTLDRKNDTDSIEIFLIAYFNAFAKRFGYENNNQNYYWPYDEKDLPRVFDSILIKTTGLGAIIRLIPNFYGKIKNQMTADLTDIESQIFAILSNRLTFEKLRKIYPYNSVSDTEISKKISGELYFSKSKGKYAGGAGKGMQSSLYKELLKDLQFNEEQKRDKLSLFDNE